MAWSPTRASYEASSAALLGGALGSGNAATGSADEFLPMLLSPLRRVRTHADGGDLSPLNDEFLRTALGTPV